jgi:hypothetical protein
MRKPGPQSLRRAESANAIIELSGELLNFADWPYRNIGDALDLQ